jgi:hypothetical protein
MEDDVYRRTIQPNRLVMDQITLGAAMAAARPILADLWTAASSKLTSAEALF